MTGHVRRLTCSLLFAGLMLLGVSPPVQAQQPAPAAGPTAPARPQAASPGDATPPPASPAPAPAPASTQPSPAAAVAAPNERLASARAILTRVEQSLERHDLTDQALQGLRGDLDPVAQAARALDDELTPRLAAVKTRLDQLGPKPDAKAPPENASVTEDRDQQQKVFDALDATLKQARLLGIDADQVQNRIVSRRRELFARAVFSRSYSILDFGLWSNALRELPGDAAAALTIGRDWVGSVGARLGPAYGTAFLALLAAILVFYLYVAGAARRLLSREPATDTPTPLAKILGALLVAFVTAVVPIVCVLAIAMSLKFFGLVPDRLDQLLRSITGSVTRISLTAGLARGLLAPSRANWRLLDLRDETCDRLVRLALTVAFIVSAGKVLDAVYDLIAASLPVSVATRGVLAWTVAITMALSLRGILPADDPSDECLGPKVTTTGRDWYGPLRLAAWAVIIVIFVAVLVGYVAFGTFLVDQLVWVSFIGAVLYLLMQLVTHGISAALRPQAPIGRGFVTSVGLRRESLEQLTAILSGVASIAFYVVAVLLVLAPWGIESDDMFGSLQAAFFGFRIGDVTISLSSIALAVFLFAVALAITRALQNWLDQRFLPLTQLDTGLRNSIRTSLGYVGFLIAAIIGLGQVGLDFQKLAIVAGALSVGIGFGLQSIVNNFVSGLIILWERAIRVGDWVVVGDEQGHVRRINVRSTEIETFDRATMIVPNSNLVTGVVKNWVRGDKIGRIRIPLTVPMGSDPDKVRDTLIACAKSQDLIVRIPAPQVLLSAIGTADLKFELVVYVSDVESSQRARSDLNFEILRRFQAEGVPIAPAAAPAPTAIVNFQGLERLEKLVALGEATEKGQGA